MMKARLSDDHQATLKRYTHKSKNESKHKFILIK